jgi:secretory phospholipase A2
MLRPVVCLLICLSVCVIGHPVEEGKELEGEVAEQMACLFQCKVGSPVQNPDHKPSFNGCGSYGIHIDFNRCAYLTACCNAHDLCYDTCLTSRDECDNSFRECNSNPVQFLDKDTKGLCTATGEAMYFAVRLAGCSAFKNAQANACICQ